MSKRNSRRRRIARNIERVWEAFDQDALARICELPEREFAAMFNLETVETPSKFLPDGFYAYGDRGGSVLAVAHLDTVADADLRRAAFLDTAAGPVIFSRALDDRLGAYVILDLLPKLGVVVDVLLTTGEEECMSTAEHFEPDYDYNWTIEFDRGGTDVVLYQYDCADLRDRITASGADVGMGSYSDVAVLDHLGVKGINWGVGYQDYHGPRAHAFLADTVAMVAKFLTFHERNMDEHLEHKDDDVYRSYGSGSTWGDGGWGEEYVDLWESLTSGTWRDPDEAPLDVPPPRELLWDDDLATAE